VQTQTVSLIQRTKTGLTGCGNIGPMHAEAVATLSESDFEAVCDTGDSRAGALAAKHGAPQVCADLNSQLKSGIEALMVCTPNYR